MKYMHVNYNMYNTFMLRSETELAVFILETDNPGGGGGGGGCSCILGIRVCAAEEGMVFKPFCLL